MAKITNRRLGELLQHLFRVLQQYPDGLKARDALAQLEKTLTLTEHESGEYESGRRFEKIVRFATVDTVRAGWLIKDSGVWTVTDNGIMALKNWPDPLEFYREASRLYRKWRKESKAGAQPQAEETLEERDEIGEEDARDTSITFEQAEDQARTDIESFLEAMPPYDFQNLVGELLRAMGYFVEWIAPPGRDGGVDIVAYTDPLGTQGPRIKVQVKRQQQSVGLPDLKSFVANIGQLDSGIFVCTGGFTKDASEYARSQESKRLMLINTDKLVKLWIEFTPKLSDRAWQRLPLTPIYFLTTQQ
ncbi:MAG: Mrr restriction system protein [Desulfovibrio sp.]